MKYKLTFSSRKTMAIVINKIGEVEVKAPYKTPVDKVELFVNSKLNWINKHLKIINDNLKGQYLILNKEKMYNFGEAIDFSIENLKKNSKNGQIYIIDRCNNIAKSHNIPVNSIKFKNYKSRWGTCDINKNITFSNKLFMLDIETIDFVIYHELCHIYYMNHKKRFHNLLKTFVGNEKKFNKKLKSYDFLLKINYK